MQLSGSFDIDASRTMVWERIIDPGLMAVCIPGCESITQVDDVTYDAVVVVSVGVISARFQLVVEVVEQNAPSEVLSRTSGVEGGRASTLHAENRVSLTELSPEKTRVDYASEVNIAGRLGKFGLGVMRKHVEKMAEEFAANFAIGIVEGRAAVESRQSALEKTERKGLLQRLGLTRSPQEDRSDAAANDVAQVDRPVKQSRGKLLFPESVEEAVDMLSREPSSFPLAGGATLIAMRNAGLVEVSRYVSLERVAGIQGIAVQDNGSIRVGAMTRHCETASSDSLTGTLRVLREAAGAIANMPVRNMGTMGGSLAHADPAADYLAALSSVDAQVVIVGPTGERVIAIDDLIVDWYQTCLEANELITSILLPAPQAGYSAYRKVARVSGDYAVASCAISVGNGASGQVGIAIGGCGPAPVRVRDAEPKAADGALNPAHVDALSAALVGQADPVDDVRGSATYRRNLIPRLVSSAIAGYQQAEGV